ncbi:MAG: hypothetical protein ACW98X_26855 [Promethearchaeota archaeon]|jgi:hypothetical protein
MTKELKKRYRPTLQTDLSYDNGNCLAACISTLYDIEIGNIPDFEKTDKSKNWIFNFSAWLDENFNKFCVLIDLDLDYVFILRNSLTITEIQKNNREHAVITKGNKIIFDPQHIGETNLELTKEHNPLFLVIGDIYNKEDEDD